MLNTKAEEELQKIIEQKEKALERENFEKYIELFEIAIASLKNQDVLLYGGFAIHTLLPQKSKIYGRYELPDIDIFAVNTKAVAKNLVAAYKSKGHSLAGVKEALHEGTWKVFVDGLQVVDITEVDPVMFETLKEYRLKTDVGLWAVNINFLRNSLHLMLSRPINVYRWGKLHPRFLTFLKRYPIKKKVLSNIPETSPWWHKAKDTATADQEAISERANKWLKRARCPCFVVDFEAVKSFLLHVDPKPASLPHTGQRMWMTKDDPMDVAASFIKFAGPRFADRLTVTEDKSVRTFTAGPCAIVSLDGKQWLRLFQTLECTTYFTKTNGMRMGSLDACASHFYNMYLDMDRKTMESAREAALWAANALSFIKYTTLINMKHLSNAPSLVRPFPVKCMGDSKGRITLRREQLERKAQLG